MDKFLISTSIGGATVRKFIPIAEMAKEMIRSSSIPMDVLGILREGIKIFKSEKLIHSIALFLLIPSSLLFLVLELALQNTVLKLVTDEHQQAKSPIQIKWDVRIILAACVIIIFASFAVSFFSMVATIYASAMAYSGKHLTLKELLSKIGGIWKRPMITRLYVSLFNIIFVVLYLALIALMVRNKGSISVLVLIIVVALFVFFLNHYLFLFCMMGIVVSVLEDGFSGIRAFKKAKQLIEGKKLQGFLLSLVLALVTLPGSLISILNARNGHAMGPIEVAVRLVLINMGCILQLYGLIVYAVYYFECKKNNGEKAETEVGSGYSLVVTSPLLVDASLP